MSRNTSYRLGIDCPGTIPIQDKLLVSGLQILDPDLALSRGYGHREVIVPTEPYRPTPEQIEAIIPNEHTTHVVRLLSLPASIANSALRHIQSPGFSQDTTAYIDLGNGFRGAPLGYRLDGQDQVNVSLDDNELKVGDHIDTWEDPGLQLAILNIGPGERWHRIAPTFCRDDMNGELPSPKERHAHMRNMLEAGENLLTYWISLGAPAVNAQAEPTVEAIVSSPVARYLHEGSTYGATEASTAVFIATPQE